MSAALDHYEANSLRLSAERIAHSTQIKALADKIADAASKLAHAENTLGVESKEAVVARSELRTLKQRRANIKFPALIDPLPEVEAWLKANPKAEAVDPITADIKRGETPMAAYQRRQQITANILANIRSIQNAPADPDEAIVPLVAQIEQLAEKGKPRVVNGVLVFPKTLAGTTSVDHAIAVAAFVDRGRFIDAVKALVLLEDDGPTITALERNNALEKAFVELTDALRQESAVAVEAEKAGQRIVRRRNVFPALLVGAKASPSRVYAYLTNGGRT